MKKYVESQQQIDKTILASEADEQTGNDQYIPAATAETLQIGSIIKNRFVLVEELGRGGMGVVYKALDKRKQEAQDRNPYIALKVLGDEFKKNPDSFIALQRESRKSQDVAHPNILTVYDFDKDGPHVFMTMECLDGKPLSDLIQDVDFRAKSLEERWSIIKQIGLALAYAHEKNIIHLDLKPSNICVKKDGTVKVLDFGIAKAIKNPDQTQTSRDTTVFKVESLGALTPPYASCEMLENIEADFRDDIYALACVAYEILTGSHPFLSGRIKIPATQARDNHMVAQPIDEISKKQRKALLHALAFARQDRTPTVYEFLREAKLINPIKVISEETNWNWASVLITVVLVLAGVFAINYYIRQQETFIEPPVPLGPSIPAKPLTEAEKQKITRLLDAADMHYEIGFLTEPRGTNAMEAYQQVLLIDPQNNGAKTGLRKIADYHERLARKLWEDGERESSIKIMKKGLKALPGHRGLLTFQQMAQSSQ